MPCLPEEFKTPLNENFCNLLYRRRDITINIMGSVDTAARVTTETNTSTLSICNFTENMTWRGYFPHIFLQCALSWDLFSFWTSCWQRLASYLLATEHHVLALYHYSGCHVSPVWEHSRGRTNLYFKRQNRNGNADDVSLAKQLLALAPIFTLGNNKQASLRRIAGLESQWFSPMLHKLWDLHFWATCGMQTTIFNPQI